MYNTDINIIGSIPDYNMIYKAIKLYSQHQELLEDAIIKNNEFDFRTEKSRKRFLSALYSAFLSYKNPNHKILIENLFASDTCQSTLYFVLFWQFSIINELFFEINKDVFIKNYFYGRTTLSTDNVVAYIKELISKHIELKGKWSEVTVATIASKYLTILKKLDLVDGSIKKVFKNINVSNDALLVFIELILAVDTGLSDFTSSKYFTLAFMSKDEFLGRAKELALKGKINMQYNGISLKIESKNCKGLH